MSDPSADPGVFTPEVFGPDEHVVLVIGDGPAGATAAALAVVR